MLPKMWNRFLDWLIRFLDQLRAKRPGLTLVRPLAIFDLETTGTSPERDRIVTIAILKVFPGGLSQEFYRLVNPEIEIPQEATQVHGITNEDVKEEQTFKQIASDVLEFLHDCDLAGFNVLKFDVPVLQNAFKRAAVEFSLEDRRIIDAYRIFIIKEPRSLGAAYRHYCGGVHTEAHSAPDDVEVCWKVLQAQVKRYEDLPTELGALHAFCNPIDARYVDSDRKFEWRNGRAAFAFGKYRGTFLDEVAKSDPGYLDWMLNGEFRDDTKRIVDEAKRGILNARPARA
jgi:DNA polymerase-3 subunit epsilon